ncbi:MAG: RecX: regulatory protein [Candidatus Parcubacteria bacterium]|jgi:regulatory protein
MQREESLQRAVGLGYFYLKFRPRTRHEMMEYFIKKKDTYKFTDDIIEEALQRLEEQKFIDDLSFVEWYVASRSKGKPKSRFALERELSAHGVDKQTLYNYFSDNELDEEALAYKAIASRWRIWSRLDTKDRFQKAAAFLMRRGFSFDLIKKTIAKYEEKK